MVQSYLMLYTSKRPIAIASFRPGLVPSGIALKLGQKVQITDRTDTWFAGHNLSTGERGIFPASYVNFCGDYVSDPVVRELQTVLREWTLLLQTQYAVYVLFFISSQ